MSGTVPDRFSMQPVVATGAHQSHVPHAVMMVPVVLVPQFWSPPAVRADATCLVPFAAGGHQHASGMPLQEASRPAVGDASFHGRCAGGGSHACHNGPATQNTGRQKLRNRKMDKLTSASIPPTIEEDVRAASRAEAAAASRDERLLRLALVALHSASHEKPTNRPAAGASTDSTSASSNASLATSGRTLSTDSCQTASRSFASPSSTDDDLSEVVSTAIGDDLSEAVSEASWVQVPAEIPGLPVQPHEANQPRIGIDIGGVLTREGDAWAKGARWSADWEAPGAFDAVREIVRSFGPRNVFLVSKVQLGGPMHQQTERWLQEMGFFEKTGVLSTSVVFVSAVSGLAGKGVVASRLGLSHFVDDKLEVLQSVISDVAGNAGDFVRRFRGVLFHFASGGSGCKLPLRPRIMEPDLEDHYCAVSCWSEVLEHLSCGDSHSASTPSELRSPDLPLESRRSDSKVTVTSSRAAPYLVHRVHVGVEEDEGFGVVRRLAGRRNENLQYIAKYSGGAKIYLCGRGTSQTREPLSVCIRAKTPAELEVAIALVGDLVSDIREEYQQFLRA